MCGLASIFTYGRNAPPVDPTSLLAIRDAMTSRGPDGSGTWVAAHGRIGLAHRRLAIIDLSDAGAQPIATADGTLRMVFNGEILTGSRGRRMRARNELTGDRVNPDVLC